MDDLDIVGPVIEITTEVSPSHRLSRPPLGGVMGGFKRTRALSGFKMTMRLLVPRLSLMSLSHLDTPLIDYSLLMWPLI